MSSTPTNRWYFTVECPATHKTFSVGEIVTPRDEPVPRPPSMSESCPHCGAVHTYLASAIRQTKV